MILKMNNFTSVVDLQKPFQFQWISSIFDKYQDLVKCETQKELKKRGYHMRQRSKFLHGQSYQLDFSKTTFKTTVQMIQEQLAQYGHDTATIRPLNGYYTATIWSPCGYFSATIWPPCGYNTATIRPRYDQDTATIRPRYGPYTATIRPQYGHYRVKFTPKWRI